MAAGGEVVATSAGAVTALGKVSRVRTRRGVAVKARRQHQNGEAVEQLAPEQELRLLAHSRDTFESYCTTASSAAQYGKYFGEVY